MKALAFTVLALVVAGSLSAEESSVYSSAEDFSRFASKLRQTALSQIEPKVFIPSTAGNRGVSGRYPWKSSIVTVLFYVGERGSGSASAWEPKWRESFGGLDNPDPAARRDYMPVNFVPRLNPFYCALPYNDVVGGHFKAEARNVIPWFAQAFEQEGRSVCRDRWLAVRKGNRICYAQWSDVGPHRSDHWEYVFGNDRPKPNANRGAALSISPAVRDYLGLESTDVTDWKFVEVRDVPPGPWARTGENNNAKTLHRSSVPKNPQSKVKPLPAGEQPQVTIHE